MSDFESEHDSDSNDEAVPATGNTPEPGVGVVATMKTVVNEDRNGESSRAGNSNEDQEPLRPDAGNVANITADFLAELKQAGEKTAPSGNQQTAEPWQLYLQQGEAAESYKYEDPNDGTIYEWDAEKRAWFPKVDEDFIAAYQATYGFTETGEPIPPEVLAAKEKEEAEKLQQKIEEEEKNKKLAGQKRHAQEPAWFDMNPEKNHNVYVSGLPSDITETEFGELMSKCGIIMEDPDTGQLKVKLYKDDQGNNKGDGRCCYLRGESVQLAIQLLDDSDYRGSLINVEQAVFHQKGEFNPSLKPKKKKKKKKKQTQEKLLDWVERDGKRSKFDRIVILKNMFDVSEFEKEPQLIIDLREEISSECEKFGVVKKVLIFDRNPQGVASVLFHEPEMADTCVEALNGRWFGGKRISAETYDGVTDYQVKESEVDRAKRIKEWEDFLAHEELPSDKDNMDKEKQTS